MDIPHRLDIAMRAAGFKDQTALSRAANVSQSSTNRILSGKAQSPDALSLYNLARACNVSVEWLISGEEGERISVALAYITSKEAELLTLYRQCSDDGKAAIFIAAESAAQLTSAAPQD